MKFVNTYERRGLKLGERFASSSAFFCLVTFYRLKRSVLVVLRLKRVAEQLLGAPIIINPRAFGRKFEDKNKVDEN